MTNTYPLMFIAILSASLLYGSSAQDPVAQRAVSSVVDKDTEPMFVLEEVGNKYVIPFQFDNTQQLLGITHDKSVPSWILISQGAQSHQVCFPYEDANITEDKISQIGQEEYDCLEANHIDCAGMCKRIQQTTNTKMNSNTNNKIFSVIGSNMYQMRVMFFNKEIPLNFLSAERIIVPIAKNPKLIVFEQRIDQYSLKQYYSVIIGQLSLSVFSYMVVDHSSDLNQDLYLQQKQSFNDYSGSQIILSSPSQTKNKEINTFILGQSIGKFSFTFDVGFDQAQFMMSFPSQLFEKIIGYLDQKYFSQCKKLQSNHVFFCQNRIKQFTQSIKLCISEKECIEINLDEMIERDDEYISQEKEDAEADEVIEYVYSYLLLFKLSPNQKKAFLYPSLAPYYKILLKEGQLYGVVKQKEQIDHQLEKNNKNKNQSHDHHTHIETGQLAKINKSLEQNKLEKSALEKNQITADQFLKTTLYVFGILLGIVCCLNYKNILALIKLKMGINTNQKPKQFEQGELMQEQTNKERKNIFKYKKNQQKTNQSMETLE